MDIIVPSDSDVSYGPVREHVHHHHDEGFQTKHAVLFLGMMQLLMFVVAIALIVPQEAKLGRSVLRVTDMTPASLHSVTHSLRQMSNITAEICSVLLPKLAPEHTALCGNLLLSLSP